LDSPKVARRSEVFDLAALLDLAEIKQFIISLEATRWTGRPGYAVRTMVGLLLTKSLFVIPTWTRVIGLVRDHSDLRELLGCIHDEDMPSIDSVYRFLKKVRIHGDSLEACIAGVQSSLKTKKPGLGQDLAIDASDIPAYANGQRFVSNGGRERAPEEYSDPDASWGHRSAVSTRKGGGFYGYRLHAAVCTATELPVAWTVETARDHETLSVSPLIDMAKARGAKAATAALDKGYDNNRVYTECMEHDCLPLIPLRQTASVKAGMHKPPQCEHGEWKFRGAEYDRQATKWECPTGECHPKTQRIKASRLHTMIPRETGRWWELYNRRASVERAFGRLKHEWGMTPLRVRGLEKVRTHVNLTMLTMLGCALLRT
jgi:transposase, IS5 family